MSTKKKTVHRMGRGLVFDNFITLSECALIISFLVFPFYLFKKYSIPKNSIRKYKTIIIN